MQDASFIAKIAELGDKAAGGRLVTTEAGHFLLKPAELEVVDLAQYQHARPPARKAITVKVHDAESFVAYFNRFKDSDSLVFAEPKDCVFIGVLDYHRETAAGEARYCEHKVTLAMRWSTRWLTWREQNRKSMAQDAFAEFVENNLADIVKPDDTTFPTPADMLEVSRHLVATSQYDFRSQVNLANGQREIQYVETINGTTGPKGAQKVPESFVVRVPIFLGQPSVDIECRLRFRINGGKLSMFFDMLRVDELIAAEFEEAREKVESATATKVLTGAVA